MKKSYKNEMMYYVKIFENDILNHRVIEDAPLKYRRDLASRGDWEEIECRFDGAEGRK